MTTIPPTNAVDPLVPEEDELLVTGWEPDTAPGDTVLRNYVATLEDRLLGLARASGGRVERTDRALLVDLQSSYVFDNIVVPTGFLDADELDEVMTRAAAFFPTGTSWSVQALSPAVDLARYGLTLLGHPPLMYRPAGGEGPPTPDGLEIRRVASRDDLALFEQTLVRAYPLPPGSAVVGEGVLDEGFCGWVGLLDGVAVATAGSHTAHGLTEVEWVSTLADCRGRGVGAALTWAATTVEPDIPAVLVATDDGRPVYERLGYLPLVRLAMWLHP